MSAVRSRRGSATDMNDNSSSDSRTTMGSSLHPYYGTPLRTPIQPTTSPAPPMSPLTTAATTGALYTAGAGYAAYDPALYYHPYFALAYANATAAAAAQAAAAAGSTALYYPFNLHSLHAANSMATLAAQQSTAQPPLSSPTAAAAAAHLIPSQQFQQLSSPREGESSGSSSSTMTATAVARAALAPVAPSALAAPKTPELALPHRRLHAAPAAPALPPVLPVPVLPPPSANMFGLPDVYIYEIRVRPLVYLLAGLCVYLIGPQAIIPILCAFFFYRWHLNKQAQSCMQAMLLNKQQHSMHGSSTGSVPYLRQKGMYANGTYPPAQPFAPLAPTTAAQPVVLSSQHGTTSAAAAPSSRRASRKYSDSRIHSLFD